MTSQEIADLCGVSRATVSRVINNDSNVKEETRKKVLSVIEENNYVPIESARRLAGVKSNIIGLFIMDINYSQSTTRVSQSTYFSHLANSIIDKANNNGYNVLVSIITSKQQLNEARNLFMSRTISSSIFVGAVNNDPQFNKFIELGYPIIIIDYKIEDISTISENLLLINLDNIMGAYKATKHLIENGHKKIAHITGDIRKLSGQARLSGYKKALKEAGLEYHEKYIRFGNFQEEEGYSLTKDLLEQEDITAIFAANDGMAIGSIKAIKEMGLEVPDDISVIGFDNIEMASFMTPELTTVEASLDDIAKKSVQSLLYYFKNNEYAEKEIIVPTNIICRQSIKAI
ncbi:MAG: LacI family DNA-binding transcriptional regulator [Halanaerobiales bacterium]